MEDYASERLGIHSVGQQGDWEVLSKHKHTHTHTTSSPKLKNEPSQMAAIYLEQVFREIILLQQHGQLAFPNHKGLFSPQVLEYNAL